MIQYYKQHFLTSYPLLFNNLLIIFFFKLFLNLYCFKYKLIKFSITNDFLKLCTYFF